MELNIGIIGEGVTDQLVIEFILNAFLRDSEVLTTYLQPKENESGNWDKVFKYCESDEFKQAFSVLDYVVIQIDTDFMASGSVAAKYQINTQNVSVEEIVQAFRTKLIKLIGKSFFDTYANQIIFAIAVSEIECWFLPAYFPNQKQKATKIENCIETLNQVLQKQEGFVIKDKKLDYYEAIAKKYFKKKRDIEVHSKQNKSLAMFLEEINQKISIKL
jgi:predicted solute-binding protein